MSKAIKARLKLLLTGGAATPAPPVGNNLGQHKVNIMEFCKKFNAATQKQAGMIIPCIITVYSDRSFTFILKTPPASILLLKAAKIEKGSKTAGKEKVGKVTKAQVEEIAKIKMQDLTAIDLEQAKKIIAGSARSIGIDVVD